jgi:hypothetical protein
MIMKRSQLKNDENFRNFSNSIANKIREGFTLEERNDKLPFAILSKEGKRVNHPLNFFIFCITLGLWSVAWIYLSYVSRAKKILVALDEDGNVFQENCYMG